MGCGNEWSRFADGHGASLQIEPVFIVNLSVTAGEFGVHLTEEAWNDVVLFDAGQARQELNATGSLPSGAAFLQDSCRPRVTSSGLL